MVDFDKIESLYRSHSESLEVPPPPDGWNRLEASLNGQNNNRKVFWLWMSGLAASLLVILSIGTYFWLSPKTDDQISFINSPQTEAFPLVESEQKTQFSENSLAATEQQEDLNLLHGNNTAQQNALAFINHDKKSSAVIPNQGSNFKNHQIVVYRNSNIGPLNNYFVTDKVKVKTLKTEKPPMDWENFYKVNTVLAEKEKESGMFGKRVEIGGVYSPVYAFRQTSGPSGSGVSSGYVSSSVPDESGVVYGGGGLRVNVMVNKKWSIETGIRMARMGQEINSLANFEEVLATNTPTESNLRLKRVSLGNSMGTVHQSSSSANKGLELFYGTPTPNYHVDMSSTAALPTSTMEQNIDYLEVPFTLRYYVINKDMSLSLSAGFSTNWLISNNVYITDNSTRRNIGETDGLSSMTLSTHAGVAFSVPVFGRLSLQLEPRVNYFLSPINKDYPVSYQPYSFGVYTGLQYSFGK